MEAAGEYPAEINMELTEILLILLGIVAFAGSFIIPENMTKNDSQEIRIPEEKIMELLQNEVKQAVFQIEEKTDETMSASAEKTERYMERICNEKIMAIQEYSDTVLNQINRNHEEAVFLYDMLNNKHVQIKNTAAEISNQVQNVKAGIEYSMHDHSFEIPTEPVFSVTDVKDDMSKSVLNIEDIAENINMTDNVISKRKVSVEYEERKESNDSNQQIKNKSESDSDIGSNKSRILKLHQKGITTIEIAKSLGLGIGEVKLIIDLFENGE